MKRLVLIRHGKSTWDYHDLKDIDRPLNERGVKSAYEMADRCVKRDLQPDLIVTSTATRALSTAIIFSRVLDYDTAKLSITKDLYHADAHEILDVVKQTDNSVETLFVFGHNPGFTEFPNSITNEYIGNVPTAGMVCIKLNIDDWSKINFSEKGDTVFFDYPKNSPNL